MNLYNLFEAPKRTPAPGTTGVMDNQVQSAASPIGSGTSRWESKKKPVTMMGVGNNGVVAEARDVQLDEISNAILGSYKKAASADASAADRRGDFEHGDKRFKGIVRATIKQGANDAKRHKEQGVAEGSLNEFAPGEGGFGPFKVYISNEFIEEFSTFDQAKEEIEFLRTADPKSFDADWKIIDGTGKIVWQHDPGEAIDAMRMRRKIQFIKPDDKGVAEASWNPVDHGDFPVNYDADTVQDAVGVGDASKWKAMTQYYSHHINVTRALDDLYRAVGSSYYDPVHKPVRFVAKLAHGYKDGSTETKYFDTKDAVYQYAKSYGRTVLSIEKVDTSDDDSGLIKLPVLLGVGAHKKKWILPFPDENYAQKWQFKHKNVADIQWPAGHDLAENAGRAVNDKGLTQHRWLQLVQTKFPDAKIVQAKMIDGPCRATLPDGRTLSWVKAEQGGNSGSLKEFASGGSGDSGNYFQALASAWYNGTFDSGSLQKGIKSQQDVERLLNRGIVCPDGKTRKLHIDYNSDFDGVEIYSDDYYNHGDESGELDSRTGQPWGPYDFMAFSDNQLDESAKWRDPKYKGQLYTQEKPDYNDTREYDNAMWNPKPKGYPGRKELAGGSEYDRTDPLVKGYGRSGIKHNILDRGKRKGLPSRDQITSLKQSIRDVHGQHASPNLPESLGRATPKMPKPRDPGHAVLAAKRSSGAAGQHTNKKRQALLQPKHQKPLTRDMDMNEDIERHLMQMRHAGYDI